MKVHKITKNRLERLPNPEQSMLDTYLGKPKVWKKLGIKIRDLSKSYSTPKREYDFVWCSINTYKLISSKSCYTKLRLHMKDSSKTYPILIIEEICYNWLMLF